MAACPRASADSRRGGGELSGKRVGAVWHQCKSLASMIQSGCIVVHRDLPYRSRPAQGDARRSAFTGASGCARSSGTAASSLCRRAESLPESSPVRTRGSRADRSGWPCPRPRFSERASVPPNAGSTRGALPTHRWIETGGRRGGDDLPRLLRHTYRIGEDVPAGPMHRRPVQGVAVRRFKYACCRSLWRRGGASASALHPADRGWPAPPRRWSPRCWYPNMPTTFRFTAKPRFTLGRGSIWTARPWPTGSGGQPSCCVPFTNDC